MNDSGFLRADEVNPNLALGYTRHGSGVGLRANHYHHGAGGSAAGGAYVTAPDLMRFYQAAAAGKLLDAERTRWFFGGNPADVAKGAAGGAPGINASVDWEGSKWAVTVTANLDPPAATQLGAAIARQLAQGR
jgi:hypothetical protein